MGNWINKEWTAQIDSDDEQQQRHQTHSNQNSADKENDENRAPTNGATTTTAAKMMRKKVTSLLSSSEYQKVNNVSSPSSPPTPIGGHLTPIHSNKPNPDVFDPRSPSSDILRTPIYMQDENNGHGHSEKSNQFLKKTILNNMKNPDHNRIQHQVENPFYDPRSPSNAYNRTPIQVNKFNLGRPQGNENNENDNSITTGTS